MSTAISKAFLFQERWYQTEAELAPFRYYEKGGTGNGLICMPTGTGKSLVIANFIKRVFSLYPNQRIMMLTHVKELIEQNAEKLLRVWPTAPLGIYSAGLNSRDMILPIVYGGVKSVKNAIERTNNLASDLNNMNVHAHFGHRDLVLIDECHLFSEKEDTDYAYVIKELKKINPNLKVIGLTATPYRMKQGHLTDKGGIFDEVIYDITALEPFNRLIAEGFLAPLIPQPTDTFYDISQVKISGGDYVLKQLQKAVNIDKKTYEACVEMVTKGSDRKTWLVFTSGIEHSDKVADCLNYLGIKAVSVHSKKPEKENTQAIKELKNGTIRAIVNADKLTTGFDCPAIDLIGMLRHTLSPGLWVQMLGRGTRPSPETGKVNCLVLDFARNTERLGPINDPVIPKAPGAKKSTGEVPVKICPICSTYVHTTAKFCPGIKDDGEECGYEFQFQNKLFESSHKELIKSDLPQIEYFKVDAVFYNLHEKRDKITGMLSGPPSMKVSYVCGLRMFFEWICLEHVGNSSKQARDWWRMRHYEEPPKTSFEAVQKSNQLRKPTQIKVWVNKKYPEILSADF